MIKSFIRTWIELCLGISILIFLAACSANPSSDTAANDPGWTEGAADVHSSNTPTPGFVKATAILQTAPSPTSIPTTTSTATSTLRVLLTKTPSPAAPTQTPTHTASFTKTQTPVFSLCSPLADYPLEELEKIVSEPYHPPPMGSDERHQGVDFTYHSLNGITTSIDGVGIQSVLPGVVAAAVEDSFPYGSLVIVETRIENLPTELVAYLAMPADKSLYLLYAHMQSPLDVQLGNRVEGCQRLGRVGHTGNTEASHLHLETRFGPPGISFPVMSAFINGVTPEERENYVLWRKSGIFFHFDPMRLLVFGL